MKFLKLLGFALLGGIFSLHLNFTIQLLIEAIDQKQSLFSVTMFAVWTLSTAGAVAISLWLIFTHLRKGPDPMQGVKDLLKDAEEKSEENRHLAIELISRLDKFHKVFRIDENGKLSIIGTAIRVNERDEVELSMPATECNCHSDDAAIDMFAEAMKAKLKLKRAEGWSGWEVAEPDRLIFLLSSQVNKENLDPIDVANYAAFLWNRN